MVEGVSFSPVFYSHMLIVQKATGSWPTAARELSLRSPPTCFRMEEFVWMSVYSVAARGSVSG